MNNAKTIADYTFKDIFQIDNPFSLDELQKRFAIDIPKASKVKCALSDNDTWAFGPLEGKTASQNAIEKYFKENEWMQKSNPMKSISDILEAWDRINFQMTEKYINSTDILKSDSIINSNDVYQSFVVSDSKNIVFSYNIFDCNYMIASRDATSCTLGIRVKESIYCSSNFEISWSNKVSKSMFIHDGYDLYECLFCSHIRSKKYCIANIQFRQEEYFKLKKEVVHWILNNN